MVLHQTFQVILGLDPIQMYGSSLDPSLILKTVLKFLAFCTEFFNLIRQFS